MYLRLARRRQRAYTRGGCDTINPMAELQTPYTPLTPTEWRTQELQRAGINKQVSRILGITKSDLHKILEAHQAGCPDDLLLTIYDDTEFTDPDELQDPVRNDDTPLSKRDT